MLAWSADRVELFFLQIQVSGQVRLENGERIRVGYADQNGHPYRSLGRYLVDRGETPRAGLDAGHQGVGAANPGSREALNHNASYVFFRELPPTDGPIGALGVPLPESEASPSTGASCRSARRCTWRALSAFGRAARAPDGGARYRRRDPRRGARGFFWGTGPDAGAQAGRMRQQGKMWLLWPIGEPPPPGPASP